METKQIKRLPDCVVKDIQLKNQARRLANLSPIKIKVRECIRCGELFESAGNRTCGCHSVEAGFMSGRDMI